MIGLSNRVDDSWTKKRSMITVKDLYDIVGKKLANEVSKTIIRNSALPQIAE